MDLSQVAISIANDVKTKLKNIQHNHIEAKPSFCIVDDDCRNEAYLILKPMLESRGIKGTFALITGEIGIPQRMPLSQILEMKSKGHEFISHTHTHQKLTTLTDNQVVDEFKNSVKVLKKYGMTSDIIAYPNGAYNKNIIEIAKKYFKCAMITGTWHNSKPLHTYTLSRLGVGAWGFSDFASIKSRIDTMIADKTLCILMTHVGDNTAQQNSLIEQTLDYIIGLGHKIKTFSEAYEEHKNILEYGEYNNDNDMSQFAIGVNGVIGGNGANPVITTLKVDSVSSTTSATNFANKKLTYCKISNSNATGFPKNIGGTLVTNRISDDDIFINQEYTPYLTIERYFRYWNPYTPAWSKWYLANHIGGTTRPTSIGTGGSFFDTAINKPIWWNGVNWVDATGTTV